MYVLAILNEEEDDAPPFLLGFKTESERDSVAQEVEDALLIYVTWDTERMPINMTRQNINEAFAVREPGMLLH